jgi:hypothetical protein
MNNIKFFTDFTFDLSQNPCSLKQLSKYHLTKALKKLFKSINKNLTENQIIGIILKVKFVNDSIKTISTLRKGDLNSIVKFSTLFKHLLVLRSEKEDLRVISIIFTYHIYPLDYNLSELETEINEISEIKSNDNSFIDFKEDKKSNLRYMNPMRIFKLPLLFAGSNQFINTFKLLNKNVSEIDNINVKYKIIFNYINNLEVGVEIVLQENTSITIYKFKDKLITVPKLDFNEILIERTIISVKNEIFLIDLLNSNILLTKAFNQNNMIGGFDIITLRKFITFKIYSTDVHRTSLNLQDFDPVLILAHDFHSDTIHTDVLRYKIYEHSPHNCSNFNNGYLICKDKLHKLANFFTKFIDVKYNKFSLYSHSISKIDWLFILESLLYLSETYEIKVTTLTIDNEIVSIRVKFGLQKDGSYGYYFDIKDSFLLFRSSLNNLKHLFDTPELFRMKSEYFYDLLSNETVRKEHIFNKIVLKDLKLCLESDVLNLSNLINKFSELINDKYKINIHKHPEISSLALAIYFTSCL